MAGSPHLSDLIHAILVAFIVSAATLYATLSNDHSSNIWIVYGSAVAFAAGRAGATVARHFTSGTRETDPAP